MYKKYILYSFCPWIHKTILPSKVAYFRGFDLFLPAAPNAPKSQNVKIHVENLAHQKSNNLQYNPLGLGLIDQASDGPSIILIDWK